MDKDRQERALKGLAAAVVEYLAANGRGELSQDPMENVVVPVEGGGKVMVPTLFLVEELTP